MGKETIDNSNETHQQHFESLSTVVLIYDSLIDFI